MLVLKKPTKEQFLDFLSIRDSGVTNMFDIPVVCSLSTEGLTEGICRYIIIHFVDLLKEYNIQE